MAYSIISNTHSTTGLNSGKFLKQSALELKRKLKRKLKREKYCPVPAPGGELDVVHSLQRGPEGGLQGALHCHLVIKKTVIHLDNSKLLQYSCGLFLDSINLV